MLFVVELIVSPYFADGGSHHVADRGDWLGGVASGAVSRVGGTLRRRVQPFVLGDDTLPLLMGGSGGWV